MRQDEKLLLVMGAFGAPMGPRHLPPPPAARFGSAGYVPGIARLGIPPQWQTDGGIGVATQAHAGHVPGRTALPAGIATAATWNPQTAYHAGAMIGREARASGFDVMLAGGLNLARDPRGGRTFEYAGEDPLLAGTMVGAEIAGIQSNHIIATVKHYALNDQEAGRMTLSAQISHASARASDLLAFEVAIERGDPGAVMCAYNRVNGVYACQNDWLLTHVLKQGWHYPYYVMSDWGAVHATVRAANAGLDQESAAAAFDQKLYFGAPLAQAIADGRVPQARLDDMVRRILLALFAKGVVDHPIELAPLDLAADAAISRTDAEQSMVLLKNAGGILPLVRGAARIAVIGGRADLGVLSGGGSSQVYPPGGSAVPGLGPVGFPGPMVYDRSPPLAAIATRLPHSRVAYADGRDPAAAAALAAHNDIAIVFATAWSAESLDHDLTLPDQQDALIARVAAANPRTIVVLETGFPVLMPWVDQVAAVLEAWYPGSAGGEAIARVLLGEVDPAGRLPITFPASLAQLPVTDSPTHLSVDYAQGAALGYKWFDRTGQRPLFPFGFGLSYGHVSYAGLAATVTADRAVVSFSVHNDSARSIADVPQLYLAAANFGDGVPQRLVGWQALSLPPGARRTVRLQIDPRLLANWNPTEGAWTITAGRYSLRLGTSSRAIAARLPLTLTARTLTRP